MIYNHVVLLEQKTNKSFFVFQSNTVVTDVACTLTGKLQS